MPRWVGLMGSWALLAFGLSLAAVAVAGEWINVRDAKRIRRIEKIDRLVAARLTEDLKGLRSSAAASESAAAKLQSKVDIVTERIDDLADSDQTVHVSTAENKVYLRSGERTIFEAICSTGKGTKLETAGRTLVFSTPIGRFEIISKEINPVWVPPDWHYVEEARKKGKRVVRLNKGDSIDADTGGPALDEGDSGVWGWFGERKIGSKRVLKVKGNTVVEVANGVERELPPGEVIRAGDAIVIPPLSAPQRRFDKVLGSYRLNLGDGYAIHGTLALDQLGRSVSHGCVRLADADIEKLYQLTKVGDEVIIY